MVRPLSRNRDLYTAKVAKATETPSGFRTGIEVVPETLRIGKVQSPRQMERTRNPRVLLHQRGLTAT